MKARVKRLTISPDVLFHIFKTGTAWQVESGLPDGSRFRGFTVDLHSQCLNLFVENENFEEIDIDSEVAPTIEALFKKI